MSNARMIFFFLLLLKVSEEIVGATKKDVKRKPHFLLVHGTGGGAWCWYKIKSRLEDAGFKASTLDLRGAGIDTSANASSVHTISEYNEPLFRFLSALPRNEKVILVGHSSGGLSITQASHKFAPKIRLAVYLAATMLKFGFVTDQDRKEGIPGKYINSSKPPNDVSLYHKLVPKISHQLSDEDKTLVKLLARPAPIYALTTARFTDNIVKGDIDKVRRIYIRTMRDKFLRPEQQLAMLKRWPPHRIYRIFSDHAPYLSAPSQLYHTLVKIAASYG